MNLEFEFAKENPLNLGGAASCTAVYLIGIDLEYPKRIDRHLRSLGNSERIREPPVDHRCEILRVSIIDSGATGRKSRKPEEEHEAAKLENSRGRQS
jgi:hypothetical protein